jgi:hypothetical protein
MRAWCMGAYQRMCWSRTVTAAPWRWRTGLRARTARSCWTLRCPASRPVGYTEWVAPSSRRRAWPHRTGRGWRRPWRWRGTLGACSDVRDPRASGKTVHVRRGNVARNHGVAREVAKHAQRHCDERSDEHPMSSSASRQLTRDPDHEGCRGGPRRASCGTAET